MSAKTPLIAAAEALRSRLSALRFAAPTTHVYDPLDYAWELHAEYLRRYGSGRKRVVFLGMNPGPFGMAQNGVPFGEIAAVRDWLGITGTVERPRHEHPKRPILGLACPRSEVSGRRLWGLFATRFVTPQRFFAEHFVANYCPLVFMEASGKNRTPDQLPAAESARVAAACDEHLRAVVAATQTACVVGVGRFAALRAAEALAELPVTIAQIPHPSPANPAANKDWAGAATKALIAEGVWKAD
jgi:single-strand selective monofunctional uracil DNA glycosylase